MREIIFRGKRIDNGEWVYGDLTRYSKEMSYITVDLLEHEVHQVRTETIGQYTGLQDRKENGVYEGDVVKTAKGFTQVILWVDYYSAFVAEIPDGDRPYLIDSSDEIIGNIHDNPELIGGNE